MPETVYVLSNQTRLTGQLFSKENGAHSKRPLVIILTGDGPSGIKSKTWPPLIDALLDVGIDVFAFDFHSQGYSEGSRLDLNLSVGCQNFMDAIRTLQIRVDLYSGRLGLIGSSFGAAVFLNSPALYHRFAAVCLKSPASFLAESYETEHGFPEGMEQWRNIGVSAATGISYSAYLDALHYNPYVRCADINCPVLIIHGTADDIVPINQSRRLKHLIGPNASLVELPNVKHDYKQEGAAERMVREAVSFLRAQLRDA
jgi:pimeloyl-ACP methyl ester carboxylesterase